MDKRSCQRAKAAINIIGLSLNAGANNGSFSVSASANIPLVALGKGPEYLSAIPIYKNDKLTILFNDNLKNKGITSMDDVKPLGNYNKSVVTLFEYDNSGKLTRVDKESNTSDQLIVRPGIYFDITDDEYIIYSSKKSVDKLGRLFVN